jgi:hypothetical protein
LLELATIAETIAGIDNVRAVTSAGLLAVTAVNKSIGIGQTRQNVTTSRTVNTLYTNSTGRPIGIAIRLTLPDNASITLSAGGVAIIQYENKTGASVVYSISEIILVGETYSIQSTTGTLVTWYEIRT